MRKKILGVVTVVVLVCCIGLLIGSVQNDKVEASIVEVNGDKVTFIADGKERTLKCDASEEIEEGCDYVLIIFDCENLDRTDDVILKAKRK